jgi:Asp-tRNA(Asn)/Glu-tRNA(Gln) amidotransferase A subunit family amidase
VSETQKHLASPQNCGILPQLQVTSTARSRTAVIGVVLGSALALSGPAQAQEIDVVEATIAELHQSLAGNAVSAEELTAAALARIEQFEPAYNAFTFMNPDALAQARAVDARRAAGEDLGPLAGIPVVVKESIDFAGLPSTSGYAPLSSVAGGVDLIPETNASVIDRLVAAGAIVLGKTNIPAFSASPADADSSWDGPTYNAVDRSIAPGGSSTGTATAIAASFAVVGLAEETGGSIQNPAAAQSLVAIKPTFGMVSNAGVSPLAASTRDTVGVHARNVADAAIMLDVIAGYDPADPKTIASFGNLPAEGFAASLEDTDLAGKRIGLYGPGWRSNLYDLTPETEALYRRAVEELVGAGAVIVEDPFAGSGFAELQQLDFFDAVDIRGIEAMPYDLNRYLARLGDSAAANSLPELVELLGQDPIAPDSDSGLGAMNEISDVFREGRENPEVVPDLSEFAAARTSYLEAFDSVMETHQLDAVIFPQMRSAPPAHGSGDPYLDTTVAEINIAGLPAVVVPAGAYDSGAPFALIIVGQLWSDADLLGYAQAYEEATHHRIIPQLEAQ